MTSPRNTPTLKVEIAFPAGSGLGNQFILDDPVKGVLDNTTYLLSSTVFEDVTSFVTGTLEVKRGRQRETDLFEAGTAEFDLRNETGDFTPLNTASPYYPGVVPNAQIRITIAGNLVFFGRVEDFDIVEDLNKTSLCHVSCVDGLGLLANQYLYAFAAPSEFPATRIPSILEASTVQYTDPIEIIGLIQSKLGVSGLNNPQGICFDSAGNLYVADSGNNRVVKWTGSVQSTVGFSGLSAPLGVACDAAGDVYVVDSGNDRVLKWNGSSQSTVGFSGLSSPYGICIDASNNVYVADTGNGRVVKWNGSTQSVISGITLAVPRGICVDSSGVLYIVDGFTNELYKWDGTSLTNLGALGVTSDMNFVAVDVAGTLYVSVSGGAVAALTGSYLSEVGFTSTLITGLASDANGNVFGADSVNNQVVEMWKNVKRLGAQTIDDVSALDHLQQVEKAEYGWMYCDRTGTLIIRSHVAAVAGSMLTFADDGSGLPYKTIAMLTAATLLFTQVCAYGVSGNRQVAQSTAAIKQYNVRTYEMPQTALEFDSDALQLAKFVLGLYEAPEVRFDGLSVQMSRLSSAQQGELTALDLCDPVTVKRTFAGTSSPTSLTQLVESIAYEVEVSDNTFLATFTFGSIGA